ncbi:MAG: carboxypeptidase-like regulatory domain-containing protein [Planctomycetota bacterium]
MGLQVTAPPDRDDLAGLEGEDLTSERTRLVLPPGRVVRGRVVDGDGKPASAEVRARRVPEAGEEPPPGDFRAGARTDDDGRFVLRGLPRAPILLRADGPDVRPWEDDDRPFTTVDVGTSEVRLVLVRAARVTVRVLGPDGAPVRSADCAVASGARTTADTIDDGTFEFPRRPTKQVVAVARAVAADGSSPAPGLVTVNPGVDVVELRLAAGAEVRGRVVDGAGKPVAGARVAVAPREVPSDETEREATEMLERRNRDGGDQVRGVARSTTGADGGFVVKGLPAGACVVAVDPPAPFGPLDGVAADAGGDAVEIIVTTASRYTLAVVDAQGRPVPGATVRVVRKHAEGRGSERFFYDDPRVVDDAGEVTVGPLRAADGYGLEVAPPAGRADLRSVSMRDWTPADSRIALEAARTIRGRVVDGRGAPVAAARVEWDRGGSSFSSDEARTDADGRFALEGAPVGDVRLVARLRAEGEEPEPRVLRVVKAGEDDVVLTLERPATWRFTVDAKPGRAVTLWFGPPADRTVRAGVVGEDGRCVVERVPVRRATVFVPTTDDDDRCGYLPDVEVTEAPIVVPMQPSRTITIRVKLPADARLVLLDVLGPTGPQEARPALDGRWVVAGLPAGRFTVKGKARSPSAWLYATVEAEAGTEVEVVPK